MPQFGEPNNVAIAKRNRAQPAGVIFGLELPAIRTSISESFVDNNRTRTKQQPLKQVCNPFNLRQRDLPKLWVNGIPEFHLRLALSDLFS